MTDYFVQLRVNPHPEWLNIGDPYTTPEEARQFERTLIDNDRWSFRVVRAHTTYEVVEETSTEAPGLAASVRNKP